MIKKGPTKKKQLQTKANEKGSIAHNNDYSVPNVEESKVKRSTDTKSSYKMNIHHL